MADINQNTFGDQKHIFYFDHLEVLESGYVLQVSLGPFRFYVVYSGPAQ